MNHSLNSFMQLATLAVGIAIGVMIAPRFERSVQAQPQQIDPQMSTVPPASSQTSPTIIPINNYMSGPAIAGNIVLAHELQADKAVVNGYDLLLLDQNIVNYLSQLPVGNAAMLSGIGERSKANRLYTIAPQRAGQAPQGSVPNNAPITPPK